MSRDTVGVSVVEALAALLAGLLVVQLGLSMLARQREAVRRLTERSEGLAAVRIARDLLSGELRRGRMGRDWTMPSADSVSLRAFRGVGGVCPAHPSPSELLVAYDGVRAVDPGKDSLLLIDRHGRWTVRALERDGKGSGCPAAPGVPVRLWLLDGDAPEDAVLARVFEHGSYHLSGGALRYRRGAAGRQPLTPEALVTPPSRFVAADGGVDVTLVSSGPAGEGTRLWRESLWRRPGDASVR